MELINESNLENVCGGGKIAKVVEGISMKELEKRKHPQITADHVVYVVKETHFC